MAHQKFDHEQMSFSGDDDIHDLIYHQQKHQRHCDNFVHSVHAVDIPENNIQLCSHWSIFSLP